MPQVLVFSQVKIFRIDKQILSKSLLVRQLVSCGGQVIPCLAHGIT